MTQSSVEVLVRIRPIRSELRESKVAWDSLSSTSLREKSNSDAIFTFDEVFPTDCTTEELYQRRIQKSVVRRVSQGYNGTIFAYGQTGSGKSFTMLGDGSRSVGITTLCVTDLFAALSLQGSNTGRISSPLVSSNSSVEVSVSVLEIYNENLRDLLCDGEKKPPLSIRDGPNGVFVYNAVRRRVHSVEECLQVIRKGTASRMSAATFMNEQSSRSHCIVSVHIERTIVVNEEDNQSSSSDSESTSVSQDDTSSSPVNGRNLKKKLVSTLHLVDLAGSERVAKTGTTGVRMTEGGHINKSLTTLTNVINRLTEISNQTTATSAPRNTFVPYRDSRLTHLLKTAIGGNSYTVVICCISPALENVDESRSTLQFASRAKAIKNNVSLNEVVDNVKVKNRLLEMEVRRLKKLLVAQTIYNWSKDVKIKNLKEAVTLVGGSAKSNTNTPPAGGTAHLSDVYEQQQLIIDQLTSEKEALQEMCDALVSDGGGQKTTQADLQDMEEMLQESEKEKESLEAALQELQQHCTAIEGENKKRLTRIAALEKKNKELEELLETAEDESESLQGELVFLKEQLDNTQQRLVESGKGDAYLEELAKLHVSYQKLQYDYSQLQQMHGALTKQSTDKEAKMNETLNDLEDENEEMKDQNKILNSYLSRLLTVASRITGDKSLAACTEECEKSGTPINNRYITSAVRGLTAFATSHRSEGVKGGPAANGPTGRKDLLEIIRKQETLLVQKDAQRDVIIDTKLKRMQELVLNMYARNAVLRAELFGFYKDNERLFQLISKHSSVSSKAAKAGLQPRSLELALSRAMFARPVDKPYGHN